MGVITEEARRWADRDYPSFRYQVTAIDIARYARAIGETDPIHFDRAAAVDAGHRDVVAPPLFPYVIRVHAANLTDEIEEDGSPVSDVPPIPSTRAMAGETRFDLGAPIVAGDVITVEKRLVEMYEKEGRSGPLVFVKMEYRFHNQDGVTVATEQSTRIYR